MQSLPLSSFSPDTFAATDYFSRNGELLIPQGALITRRLLDLLESRNNFDLYTLKPDRAPTEASGSTQPHPAPVMTESERLYLTLTAPGENTQKLDIFNLAPGSAGLKRLNRSPLAQTLDAHLHQRSIMDRPAGIPLRSTITQIGVTERTNIYKKEVRGLYRSALQETRNLLRLLARNNQGDARSIEEIVDRFIRVFITDRNILLGISTTKSGNEDYLFHHSLNVCLLAINIAAACGYSERQVLEIGMGAIVHDIGMLLVPEELRMKQSRLTDEEWCEIRKHPVLGLHLLKKLRNMPERIPYITYQVHERENSTGYPRQYRSSLIHRYAKMVQVADIFEALTSFRPHRPPYLPNDAVARIVQMAQKKLIPLDPVKAFVGYVSLFPVGSLVELDNHALARVVHAHEHAVQRPIVSVLTSEKGELLPREKIHQIDLSLTPELSVIRTLPQESFAMLDVMDGF